MAQSGHSDAHAFVRFWTTADKAEFCPGTVCPLMTQSGHLRFVRFPLKGRLRVRHQRPPIHTNFSRPPGIVQRSNYVVQRSK
jgi:hypothetical protein